MTITKITDSNTAESYSINLEMINYIESTTGGTFIVHVLSGATDLEVTMNRVDLEAWLTVNGLSKLTI